MLKKKLVTTPVLTLPDIDKGYQVYIDASLQGMGGILIVAYASWQLRQHEHNYSTPDLEIATVVFALKL